MISVVIPNYNGEHLLKQFLSRNMALFENEGITDVIIVDDCSTDRSVEYIKTHFPQIRVIQNELNYNFGKTCNRGASVAKEDIILFLNTDMVFRSFSKQPILDYFKEPDLFALGVPIFRQGKDGGEHNEAMTKGKFIGGMILAETDYDLDKKVLKSEGMPLLWACGGAMFVSKEKFDQIEGFDSLYHPFYDEDRDLSYQAWRRGWQVKYTNHNPCDHNHQGTIGVYYDKAFIEQVHKRNEYLFIWKNIAQKRYWISHIVTVIIKLLTFQISDTRAIITALLRLPDLYFSKKSQLPRTRSDKEIFKFFKE